MAIPVGTRVQQNGKGDNPYRNLKKYGSVVGHSGGQNIIKYDDGCDGLGDDYCYDIVTCHSYTDTFGENIVWYTISDGDAIEADAKKTKKTIMQTLSVLAKRLLDADTKTLVKAGFLTTDLALTDKGLRHINAFLFDKYKAEIVAVAQAVLDEEKEDK